jgi:hypothetical protein
MADKEFKLSKPITVHSPEGAKDISTLDLREPTADDVGKLKPPIQIVTYPDGGVETIINFARVLQYAQRLSSYDAGVLGMMAPRDLLEIANWLGPLFAPLGSGSEAEKN